MRISQRDRRAFIAGLWTIAPALFWIVIGRPYVSGVAHTRERIAQQRMLAARELGLIGAQRSGALRTAHTAATHYLGERVFQARDGTMLYTRATGFLNTVARLSQVELRSTNIAAERNDSATIRMLDLAVEGSGDLPAVLLFLQRIESGNALIRISRMEVVPVRSKGNRSLDFELSLQFYGATSE